MKVFGQLEKAQMENTTSDTGSLPKGMITYRTDLNVAKVSNGTAMIALIDESSTQTMSGKTLSGGVIFNQITTPAAPSVGFSKFYTKADGKYYFMNSDGVEQEVGSGSGGGQGGKNYAPNKGTFNAGTAGWSLFTTTFSSNVPTTITGGAANLALTQETTSPLSDAGSLKLAVTTAALSAGQGIITDVMTIDDADLARVFSVAADYLTLTGAANLDLSGTSTSTFEFWVYNVGNAAWTQLVNFRPLTASIASSLAMSFQTAIEKTSNKNQYRLAMIIKNDPLGTASVLLDTVYFGRGDAAGSVTTNAFSAGLAAAQAVPLTTQTTVLFDTVSIKTTGNYNPVSGELTILEEGSYLVSAQCYWADFSGYTYTYIIKNGSIAFSAEGVNDAAYGVSTLANGLVHCKAGDVLKVDAFQASAGSQNINADATATFFNVVKVGASSAASGGRDMSVMALGPTNSITGSFSDMTGWAATSIDTVGGFNASTGVYTAKESGTYLINGSFLINGTYAAGNYVQVSVEFGASQLDWQSRSGGAQSYVQVPVSGLMTLKAGDQVKLKIASTATALSYGGGDSFNFFGITKVGGGVSAANDLSVVCQYEIAAGQSIPDSTLTAIVWDTKVIDSHNAMNTSTGAWTCPVSGTYQFNNANAFAANGTGYRQFSTDINSGASSKFLCQQIPSASNVFITCGSTLHKLKAGDVVKIMAYQTSGGALSLTGSGYDTINIVRVGNY